VSSCPSTTAVPTSRPTTSSVCVSMLRPPSFHCVPASRTDPPARSRDWYTWCRVTGFWSYSTPPAKESGRSFKMFWMRKRAGWKAGAEAGPEGNVMGPDLPYLGRGEGGGVMLGGGEGGDVRGRLFKG
jgi:hypothetical protein